MVKICLIILLFLSMNYKIGAVERPINRNSTDPLEMAIERAIDRLIDKIPEKASIAINDISATEHSIEMLIHEHFENILLDIGFILIDRNAGVFIRNYYDTNNENGKFIFIVKSTDKDIYLILINADTGITVGYTAEHF